MSNILDEDWKQNRGVEIASVGIASISYDDASTKLINMRNQGAMLSDPTIREGYVQGSVARGMEAAGSNAAGSVSGFMGMGMGMQAGAGVMGAASEANIRQMEMNRQQAQAAQQNTASNGWTCSCGAVNTGKFSLSVANRKRKRKYMSTISIKCPNCGGELIFDPKSQKYKCEYCGSDFRFG